MSTLVIIAIVLFMVLFAILLLMIDNHKYCNELEDKNEELREENEVLRGLTRNGGIYKTTQENN